MTLRRFFNIYKYGREIIGFGIYLFDESAYEYNEDSCFVFSSETSARKLADEIYDDSRPYRIVPVRIKHLMKDFGCSSHSFAIEPHAMKRFERIAMENNIHYESNLWDPSDDLIILEIYTNTK